MHRKCLSQYRNITKSMSCPNLLCKNKNKKITCKDISTYLPNLNNLKKREDDNNRYDNHGYANDDDDNDDNRYDNNDNHGYDNDDDNEYVNDDILMNWEHAECTYYDDNGDCICYNGGECDL